MTSVADPRRIRCHRPVLRPAERAPPGCPDGRCGGRNVIHHPVHRGCRRNGRRRDRAADRSCGRDRSPGYSSDSRAHHRGHRRRCRDWAREHRGLPADRRGAAPAAGGLYNESVARRRRRKSTVVPSLSGGWPCNSHGWVRSCSPTCAARGAVGPSGGGSCCPPPWCLLIACWEPFAVLIGVPRCQLDSLSTSRHRRSCPALAIAAAASVAGERRRT